jgi:DNA-damage-inducible protein J
MHKTATINTRINPELKATAENILGQIGLSPAEAVRLFYKQICFQNGLPFEVKIPNTTTIKAMQAADQGKTKRAKNIDDLLAD